MQVTITADQHRGRRGYHGADLELPASRYGVDDALQRAHVPEGGSYELSGFRGCRGFVRSALILSGSKTLEELNLLAEKVDQMNETQIGAYEGILKLWQDSDSDHPISMK